MYGLSLFSQEIDRLREVEEEMKVMRASNHEDGVDEYGRWGGGTEAAAAAVSEAPAFYPVHPLRFITDTLQRTHIQGDSAGLVPGLG